ncbi:MAG TPA: alpha/beta fold hydrolase [Acidimicrobiales bacterium]|jgi:pimeloyl-ACP methyl ester carboxylesterase|nr:alpha/beta fold hydrolase [Acidimicrobiales bacterium]
MKDRAVLMVHGFASSSAQSWSRFGWIEQFEASGRRVEAPDLPGHGDAMKTSDPNGYGVMEDEVHQWAVSLGPVDGIGFSLGARLALSAEALHPGTFDRLVVGGIGSNIFSYRSPEHLAGAIEMGDADLAPESTMAAAFVRGAQRSNNDPAALAAFLRRPKRHRITVEELRNVQCPVLVVVGGADTMVHPVTEMTRHLAHARTVTIPDADHLATMRSPDFLAAALEFLNTE